MRRSTSGRSAKGVALGPLSRCSSPFDEKMRKRVSRFASVVSKKQKAPAFVETTDELSHVESFSVLYHGGGGQSKCAKTNYSRSHKGVVFGP